MYGTYFLIKQAFFQYQKGSLTFSCQSLLMAALGNAFPLLLPESSQFFSARLAYLLVKTNYLTLNWVRIVFL